MRRRSHMPVAAVSIAIALLASACGGGDSASDGASRPGATSGRTVDVEMVDIAFEPKELKVAKGEKVTFRFTNSGKLAHDAFIGDRAAQQEHEKEMGDKHGGHGSADDAVTVKPGGKAQLTYTFDESGKFEVGCHQPGHYAAGMKIDVEVT